MKFIAQDCIYWVPIAASARAKLMMNRHIENVFWAIHMSVSDPDYNRLRGFRALVYGVSIEKYG